MLIRITEKCFENCSHCMISAYKDGSHMSQNIFEDVMKFINSISEYHKMRTGNPLMVQISGGEPTEHPLLFDFLRYINNNSKNSIVVLHSNGSFINNIDKTNKIKEILDLKSSCVYNIVKNK